MSSESSPSPSSRKRSRSPSARRSASPPSSGSSTPPRSSSADPDGPPILLRDMLLRKPGIIGSIEKLMDSARGSRTSSSQSGLIRAAPRQSVMAPTSLPPPSSPARNSVQKPPTGPSSRIPAVLKGKAVVNAYSPDLKCKATVCGSSAGVSGEPRGAAVVDPHPPVALALSTAEAAAAQRPGTPVGVLRATNRTCGMMRRPVLEPLMLNRGRSFIKHFTSPFKEAIEIPTEFWLRIPNKKSNSVIIFGDAMMGFEVRVEVVNGKSMFTEGWSDFVAAERVSRNDIGVFSSLFSNIIGMRLYGVTGAERPMSRRPPIGHPMLQDWPPVVVNPGDDVPIVPVPDNMLGMVFELGAGVLMNGPIMQMIANVWHNVVSDHPLYVCTITRSQIGPRAQFFFTRRYSRYLIQNTPTSLLVGGSLVGYPATLVFHPSNPGIARITSGWNIFASIAGFQIGHTYVVRVLGTNSGTYQIRFYFCGGPYD